jgi:hypothetical protein
MGLLLNDKYLLSQNMCEFYKTAVVRGFNLAKSEPFVLLRAGSKGSNYMKTLKGSLNPVI